MRHGAIAIIFMSWLAMPLAQTRPTQAIRFEVVSVKPNKDAVAAGDFRMLPDRVVIRGVLLFDVIRATYQENNVQLDPSQIVVPDWVRGDRFDITATIPQGATREQVQA